MADASFLTFVSQGTETDFSGWDFSYITKTGRMVEAPLPWSYGSRVVDLMSKSNTLLDMGTGGGEFLASLKPLPATVHATEGYAPNIDVARKTLEPLGVRVAVLENEDRLPYEDGTFDLILNRHEYYHPEDVMRLLKPGGVFLTQQVGGEDNKKFHTLLGAPEKHTFDDWHLANARKQLHGVGFSIEKAEEAMVNQRFYDVGAIIYYLKAVAFEIPDFSVERYREGLEAIHSSINANGFIDIPSHRFLLQARKPI
ncbi:methyltransferase family protein [Aureibacillus halotolerans]|uniref:Methyltransferase family protein n=2 Tax=Aureibacillus halotolerans TaxID=1508390 RepID=A0A4R6TVR7_9BACI|nr:class I SAM-dependent methyltransferase [Aureibacillus halotolerans]TDQ36782.1 methyltransferase family protein [Aureibacillus halotolerans]